MLNTAIWLVVAFVLGAIVGIFFYRNNQNKVGKVADVADDVVEAVKKKR